MTMDIIVHSRLSKPETIGVTAGVVKELKKKYGTRFWYSEVIDSNLLSKEIMAEEFGFKAVCGFLITDTTKGFDELHVVARSLRSALGKDNAMVI